MAYEYYNPNPMQKHIDDCYKRALTKVLGITWDAAHILMSSMALRIAENSNDKSTLWMVLRENGFDREAIPNTCPDCYTLEDFANEHFKGTYVADMGNHVAAIVDGVIYDTWDSRKMIPFFYWHKKEEEEAA